MHGITIESADVKSRGTHIALHVIDAKHRGLLPPIAIRVRTGECDLSTYATPAEARELAAALQRIADDAEKAGETIEQAATRLGS